MKNTIVLFFFIFLAASVQAQMNMDSLRNVILHSGQFELSEKEPKYLMETFQKYIRKDKLEDYDVHLNGFHRFKDYINLSAVQHLYDRQGRLIRTTGYNAKGEYSLFDYDPITTNEYSGDTTTTRYYSRKQEAGGIRVEVKDSAQRIVSESLYNGPDQLAYRHTTAYNDAGHEQIRTYYGSDNELKLHDVYRAAMVYQRYDDQDKNLLEERYYDTHHELIDNQHNEGMGFDFSILIIKIREDGKRTYYFYDRHNQLVYSMGAEAKH